MTITITDAKKYSAGITCEATASGVDAAKFQEVAEATKKGCPVSKALASVPEITLTATLTAV